MNVDYRGMLRGYHATVASLLPSVSLKTSEKLTEQEVQSHATNREPQFKDTSG